MSLSLFLTYTNSTSAVDCPDPDCGGHGFCIDGACICKKGLKGSDCSRLDEEARQCLPDCSGNGRFDLETQQCICHDAWVGDGTGPIQHFTHVRFRSVEHGLPLVRSANMGISALVNPIGQVEKIIPHGEMNFVDVKIPSKISSTFYTQFGDNIAYFFIVLFFLIGYSTSKLIKD